MVTVMRKHYGYHFLCARCTIERERRNGEKRETEDSAYHQMELAVLCYAVAVPDLLPYF